MASLVIPCLCAYHNYFADFSTTASVATTIILSTVTQDAQPITASDSVLPQSIIITIAVLGGVLVLIFIVIACSIVICCVLYSKIRKVFANQVPSPLSASTNGHLQNDQLVDNPSCNVGDNDLQLVPNQSYNQVPNLINDSQLVNNPAYNSNGQEDPYYSVIH